MGVFKMNTIISQRMHELSAAKGLSIQDIADQSGLPVESVRNLYYGRVADPRISSLLAIANVLEVGVNCLMGQCNHTKEERHLILNYRSCGRHGKSIIELIAKYEAGAVKSEREGTDKHMIPCIFPRGEIRKGIIYDMCETKEIETSIPDAFIAIQMTDNDLAPIYCKNDIILFENRFPENGEISAFFKKDRVYIRRFFEEENGQYRLKCLFPHGEDIIMNQINEFSYVGTCISVVRS